MSYRARTAGLAILLLLAFFSAPGRGAEFVDSAGRHVVLPVRILRVMPVDMVAAVFVYTLAPDKLVGWNQPLSRAQRAYFPAKYARLPVIGELGGPDPALASAAAVRWRPDLIIASGPVTPQAAAQADRIEAQTHIPYLVLDGSIEQTPAMLRLIGALLGIGDHRLDIASYAYHAIQGLRGKLLIQSPDDRPRVYYGIGSDGLTTGLSGSLAAADIDQAGAINVAAQLGHGELTRVTRQQIVAWNPDIVIAQQRTFYNALRRDPLWRSLSAVRDKHVFLAPSMPFGWIDNPAGVNRIVGLYWLSDLFYPNVLEEDLRTSVRDFYRSYYGVQLTDRQIEALVAPAAPPAVATAAAATVSLFQAEPAPEPELTPRGVPGPGSTVPLRPAGRGGLPATPPGNPP
jgi:iron complex transport system substrate-binding protein